MSQIDKRKTHCPHQPKTAHLPVCSHEVFGKAGQQDVMAVSENWWKGGVSKWRVGFNSFISNFAFHYFFSSYWDNDGLGWDQLWPYFKKVCRPQRLARNLSLGQPLNAHTLLRRHFAARGLVRLQPLPYRDWRHTQRTRQTRLITKKHCSSFDGFNLVRLHKPKCKALLVFSKALPINF